MTRSHFFPLLAVFGLIACQAAVADNGQAEASTVKVLSYNIHYGLGTDGVKDLERIAQVILRSGAGVVGLQEIGNKAMADKLGELTGMRAAFGRAKENDSGYGDAILCKYPFEWVGRESIPSASSSRYQAMAVDVDLSEIFGDGATVRLINTHFDWLDSIGSQEARLATVDVIERAFRAGSSLPMILTGDLNANPDSLPLAKLAGRGWSQGAPEVELLTWEATQPDRQIDYVLVAPELDWHVMSVEVMDEPLASDHLPIVMELQLR
ncbi:MAG: endonuclease/exonuclease/phosphatase family protein [Planctomycetes bacterium]|nr:endonuclease/exonuclease/phosphatase family protein [Planctomycetota bacterium]